LYAQVASNNQSLDQLAFNLAATTLSEAKQVIWAVAVGCGLEIFPAIVNGNDNLSLASVHKGVEAITAALDSADGIWL
jgi:hypothetical protein